MKKAMGLLDRYFEEVLLSCMMAYFVFATIAQVLARFVFHVSAPWTEETARYVFIWMTFIGASYAAKKKSHIKIDLLETSLGTRGRKVAILVSTTFFLLFILIMTVVGYKICANMLLKPQTSPVLEIPMVLIYAALPVGMFLTAIRVLQNLWRDNRAERTGGNA